MSSLVDTLVVREALLELNRRCGQRGDKVVVKLMLDRGTFDEWSGSDPLLL